jgi:hypothetical protein
MLLVHFHGDVSSRCVFYWRKLADDVIMVGSRFVCTGCHGT